MTIKELITAYVDCFAGTVGFLTGAVWVVVFDGSIPPLMSIPLAVIFTIEIWALFK